MKTQLTKRLTKLTNRFFSLLKDKLHKEKKGYTIGNWRELPKNRLDKIPRVMWVLAGDENVGSSRLKGILIDRFAHEFECGFLSNLSYSSIQMDMRLKWQSNEWSPFLKRADIVVLQTWTGSTLEFLENCRLLGIPVVFTLSDMEFQKIPDKLFKLIDAIVVSSEVLQEKALTYHNNVILIDDPIEVPPERKLNRTNHNVDPEIIWMGHPDNWAETDFIRTLLREPEFRLIQLRTVSKHPQATHQWDLDTRWDNISRSDIAMLPCRMDEWGIAKSSNRVASFMALGYPVIASPIPSYRKLMEHGKNGFFAERKEEWINYLRILRDYKMREKIGTEAYTNPRLNEIRIDNIVRQWAAIFSQLYDAQSNNQKR